MSLLQHLALVRQTREPCAPDYDYNWGFTLIECSEVAVKAAYILGRHRGVENQNLVMHYRLWQPSLPRTLPHFRVACTVQVQGWCLQNLSNAQCFIVVCREVGQWFECGIERLYPDPGNSQENVTARYRVIDTVLQRLDLMLEDEVMMAALQEVRDLIQDDWNCMSELRSLSWFPYVIRLWHLSPCSCFDSLDKQQEAASGITAGFL